MNTVSILERIQESKDDLSPKQASVAKFILDNIRDFGIISMSSSEIARKSGVSEASVSRLATRLGYRNFQELQEAIRKQIQEQFASHPFRMESGVDTTQPAYLRVFNLEQCLMQETLKSLKPEVFETSVNLLCEAEDVLLVGCPPNDFLVGYAHSFLCLYRDRVHTIRRLDLPSLGMLMDSLPRRSVALAFSFPRYPQNTQRIVEILHKRGVSVIGITDSEFAPIIPLVDQYLITPHKYLIITDPFASTMALIHSLIVGMFTKNPAQYRKRLRKYEEYANRTDIFINKDFSFAELI